MPDRPRRIAAIDLGSNSFHMTLAELGPLGIKTYHREKRRVRLAAGLNEAKQLDEAAKARALDTLSVFGQILEEFQPDDVRAVGTYTFRTAANIHSLTQPALRVLPYPIEILSGTEEARLIYQGVSHDQHLADNTLVVDIGGGSTEFVVGERFESLLRESLPVGCVSFAQQFFADGRISERAYLQAYTSARLELMPIEKGIQRLGWSEAVGASGTIRVIGQCLRAAELTDGEVTREGLRWLKRQVLKVGHVDKLTLAGLKPERRNILPPGLAILDALFDALDVQTMVHSEGALREGVLYELLGRHQHEDVRERSLTALAERSHVDQEQAARVEGKAASLLAKVAGAWELTENKHADLLRWAARIYEVGLDIAHNQYHKHGAYLIEHADLPGFSRQEQQSLALLVRGHRRNLPSDERVAELGEDGPALRRLCMLLRLAILYHHIRGYQEMPELEAQADEQTLTLSFPPGWLDNNPLTQADFAQEAHYWAKIGYTLTVR